MQGVKLVCLMPTYNKQSTIKKAMESVLMQKTAFKFKLIVLDDASNDGSYEIAQSLQAANPDKIEIVRNETNLKLLKNITNGYKLLKNIPYFCVLDADDWYIYDKKFADAVEFLEAHGDFAIYAANSFFRKDGLEKISINIKEKCVEFDWEDYKNGKGLYQQTSGVVFRNVYFKDGVSDKYLKATEGEFGEAFRCDGMRWILPLHFGKAHFENHCESVYNYDGSGIWSSQTEFEQHLDGGVRFNLGLSKFFTEDEEYFLKIAKAEFDIAIQGFRKADRSYIAKNKDLLFLAFSNTYLTDNPIFDTQIKQEKQKARKNSFIENVFSVRISPDKKRKIITILGLKIKIKRPKRILDKLNKA